MRSAISIFLALTLLGLGCASDGSGGKPTSRTSEAALKDPFGNWSKVDTDISGSKGVKPDKSELRDDVDRFWLR